VYKYPNKASKICVKGYAFEQEALQHRKRHISHYSRETVLHFLSPQFWTPDVEPLLYGDKCVYGVRTTVTIVDICIVICFTSFAKAY